MPRPFSFCPYSPECVKGKFCEVRHDGFYEVRELTILGSSWTRKVGSLAVQPSPPVGSPCR